jgi:hypothetical protein
MSERTELEEYLIEKCTGLELELRSVREEITELHCNLIYYRQFYTWAKNRLEEEGILLTENGVKKPSEMTKAELIARNELVVKKQENRVAEKPSDLPSMPEYDELLKQYEEIKPKGLFKSPFNHINGNSEFFVHQDLILNLKKDYLLQKLSAVSKKENIEIKEAEEIVAELEAVYGGNPVVMGFGQELLDRVKELNPQTI